MLGHVWFFVTPWTLACQASLSMEFSWPEYWSGWPCPSPKDIPDPGLNPHFLCLFIAGGFFTTESLRKPKVMEFVFKNFLTKKSYALFIMLVNFSKHLRNIVNTAQIFLENRLREYLIMHYIHWVLKNQFKQSYYKK